MVHFFFMSFSEFNCTKEPMIETNPAKTLLRKVLSILNPTIVKGYVCDCVFK